MKIKFLKTCMDKHTHELYEKGMEKEFEDARALEIVATGYAENVREVGENVQEVEHLEALSKKELIALAKNRGVPHSGTKEQIINRLYLYEKFK